MWTHITSRTFCSVAYSNCMLFTHKCLKQLTRSMSSSTQKRRRFYKQVTVVASSAVADDSNAHSENIFPHCRSFEVCLDHRRLRTPGGNIFRVPGQSLGLAVAQEWASCGEHIYPSSMHLTALCNTVLDQPCGAQTALQLAEKMSEMVHGDTILFPVSRPPSLADAQRQFWTPILESFGRKFGVSLSGDRQLDSLLPPVESSAAARVLCQHLASMSVWTLNGLIFAAEALRSPLLALSALEDQLSVAHVTKLSRLETEYQTEVWGRVPWSHDVEMLETQIRVGAGLLLAKLTSSVIDHEVKQSSQFAEQAVFS